MGQDELQAQLGALDPAVLEMLNEDLRAQLTEVHRSLAVANFVSARQIVHAVNGTASFCRLSALRAAAVEFESSLSKNENRVEHIGAFECAVQDILRFLGGAGHDNNS